jgi:hypothetical protein
VKGHKQQFLVCSLKGSKEFSLWKQSDAQMKRNLHFDLRLVWVFWYVVCLKPMFRIQEAPVTSVCVAFSLQLWL